MPPLVIAHRTCPREAPENSLFGLRMAADLGADGVEIDLRMSLDQRPFLMHDWTMNRTARWPLPIEVTPSQVIGRLRLRNSENVPSLARALDLLPSNLKLAIDVKDAWSILALVRAIKQRHLEDRALIWCTSARAAVYAKRALPDSEVAYLKDSVSPPAKEAFLAKAQVLGVDAVSAHWHAIDARFVAQAHDLGLMVYSYHSKYPLTQDKLASGLDGVITDFVPEAREALGIAS